jgi:hypothetical protein
MDRQSRPRRRDAVLSNSAGDTVILLHSETGEYYSLDEVGGRIWELADGTRTVAEIASALVEEFDAPLETIETDARRIFAELAREQLVDDERAA